MAWQKPHENKTCPAETAKICGRVTQEAGEEEKAEAMRKGKRSLAVTV